MLVTIAMLALMQTAPMAQNTPAISPAAPQGAMVINAHWLGKPFSLRQFMRTHFNIGALMGGPASPRQSGMAIKVCISAPGNTDCGVYQSAPGSNEALPFSLSLPAGEYDVQIWPVSFKPQAQSQSAHVEPGTTATLSYRFQWPKGLR